MEFRSKIERNIAFWTAMMLIIGFSSGIGAYIALLEITNQETVIKDSYVKKSELVGGVLRTEVIRELEHLIEIGESIDIKKDPEKAGKFFARTRAFLVGLDLPKSAEYPDGDFMSEPVLDHKMIMMQNHWYGHEDITMSEQVARILGLLQGLKSSYSARDVSARGIDSP